MSYAMENIDESTRLEEQATLPQYDVKREFVDITIPKNATVLDAGCGTGLLSRHLMARDNTLRIEAIDQSDTRIAQAKKLSASQRHSEIRFQVGDICSLPFEDSKFDMVACRFVLEHLDDPMKALDEYWRVLKPGGQLVLIDLDGILVDYCSLNPTVFEGICLLDQSFSFDLRIGRKLPLYLKQKGFKEIKWSGELLQFQGQERKAEVRNFRDRLNFCLPLFEKIFNSNEKANSFVREFLSDISDADNVLAFSKYVVVGVK